MRKLTGTLILVAAVFFSRAQDPNFSQFYSSPLTLNPAFTGKFNGSYRVAGNYRNQWPSIYNAFATATASFDAGILKNKIPEFDQFGVGVLALSDKSGEGGALQDNYAALSVAYHKALDENGYNQLGLGFQGAYINKRLDPTKLHFEDQLTTNGWTGITSEVIAPLSVSYFDLNAGLLYNGTTNGANNIYFGASVYHINKHKESFTGGQYYLQPRVTVQSGLMLPMGEFNALHLSAMYSNQSKAVNTLIGGAYMLNLNNGEPTPTNFYFGAWTRFNNVNDAIIPYLGLEFNNLQLGFTYDINISSLSPAS